MVRTKVAFPRLRELREKAGLTGVAMVHLSGVSRSLISKLEQGEFASPAKVHAVFNALNEALNQSLDRDKELKSNAK